MQSVGLVLPDPNTMLAAADRTVRAHSDEMYATALAGIFDPVRYEFTFASAGHPGPAIRHPDGSIEEFIAPGIMLGLRSAQPTRTLTIAVPPGSVLVFFTDGLVEATRDIAEGHARVHAALAETVAGSADPARALVEHVLGGKPATDDIAVLVAEIGPSRDRG
jgi:serine phosphatase RsbU (regulator of sigma subunit)